MDPRWGTTQIERDRERERENTPSVMKLEMAGNPFSSPRHHAPAIRGSSPAVRPRGKKIGWQRTKIWGAVACDEGTNDA